MLSLLVLHAAGFDRAVTSENGQVRIDGFVSTWARGADNRAQPLFAPDGREWTDYPDTATLSRVREAGSIMPQPLAMIVRYTPTWKRTDIEHDFARVRLLPAKNLAPGKDLGVPLDEWWRHQIGPGMNWLFIGSPPDATFAQVEVKSLLSLKWSKVAEFRPSYSALRTTLPEKSRAFPHPELFHPYGFTVWVEGRVDEYRVPPSEIDGKPKTRARWSGRDTEVRAVARLASGKRIAIPTAWWNGRIVDYGFSLDAHGSPVCVAKGGTFGLREVEAFEIQVRRFGDPVYLPVRLPPLFAPLG